MAGSKGKKGFAGLDSMVSEVEPHRPTRAEPTVPREEPQSEAPELQRIYQSKPESSGGSSGKWWAVGISLVILFIWIGNSDNKTASQAPSYAAAAPEATPIYTPAPSYVSEPSPTYASNAEEKPPIGRGLLFNQAQIRYCLSEKLRMSAWQNQVNRYSETSVNAFNDAVNDYNARCSDYRYQSGMLESVRAEVDANRQALAVQGMANAVANP